MTGHAKDKTEGSLPTLQHSNYSSATLDLRQSRDNIEYLLIYKRTAVKNEHFSIDKLHDFKKIMTMEQIPRLAVVLNYFSLTIQLSRKQS